MFLMMMHFIILYLFDHYVFIVTAKLGEWSSWPSCSKTCGYGIRQRIRRCIGSNQFGANYCNNEELGLSQQAERCFERSCPGC